MRSKTIMAACAATILSFTTLIAVTPASAQDDLYTSIETRAYLTDSCILQYEEPAQGANFLGAFVGIVLPYIIDFVFDQAAEELTKIRKYEFESNEYFYLYQAPESKESATEKDGEADTPTAARFPTLNPKFSCVTVVTGQFLKSNARVFDPKFRPRTGAELPYMLNLEKCADDNSGSCFTLGGAEKRLADFRIQIPADKIYSLYEGKLEASDDKTAMRIRSQFLHVDRTNNSSARNPGQTYSFALSGPGQTPDSERYMLASLNFGEVRAGTTVSPNDFAKGAKGDKSGWMKIPGITKESLAAYQNDTELMNLMPVLFTVKNTQVKEPSDAAKFIAGFLKGTKKDIASTITNAVKPEGAEKKEKDLLDARIAVATAQAELDKATTEIAKEIARMKRKKACILLEAENGSSEYCG